MQHDNVGAALPSRVQKKLHMTKHTNSGSWKVVDRCRVLVTGHLPIYFKIVNTGK